MLTLAVFTACTTVLSVGVIAEIGGPTGVRWIDWIIALSLLLGALVVIYRQAVKPVVKAADEARVVLPVLLRIAEDFRDQSEGHSLRDVILDISVTLKSNVTTLEDVKAAVEELHTYAHDTRHQHANQLQQLALADSVMIQKMEAIETSKQAQTRRDTTKPPGE